MIERISGKRKAWCAVLKGLCIVSLAIVTALTVFMLLYVLVRGVPYITPQLLFTSPSVLRNSIGILPDILNTIYIVIATLVVVLPIGLFKCLPPCRELLVNPFLELLVPCFTAVYVNHH